jgi:hypothetical protein
MRVWQRRTRLFLSIGVFVAVFAATGCSVLLLTRAATSSVAIEAENGAMAGGTTSVTVTGASGGKATKFAAAPPASGSVTVAAVSDIQYGPSGINRAGVASRVAAMNSDYVIMAGDLAYNGTSSQYSAFNSDYGAIKSKIRPTLGNHDNYSSDNGGAYNTYWGSALHGTMPNFWYSFNAGAWHIVGLNTGVSNSTASYAVGSTQLTWLESDLAANDSKPTLIFFHAPRYTAADYSGDTGLQNSVKAIWNIALAHKVELIVNGHDHSYQRFAPMDANGAAKSDGIREFIAATGGYNLRTVKSGAAPNLEKGSATTDATWCGALKLTLYSDHYAWEFQNIAGSVLDSGSATVHQH